MSNLDLRRHLDQRLGGMISDRSTWLVHWRELAEYILPRRMKWLTTSTQSAAAQGSALNNRILDSTGTIAARTLAAGMMSGITSPTRPWFKLRIDTGEEDESSPVNLWLAECEKRMMKVFQESNFYNSMAILYQDLGTFGTGCVLIYEDYEDVIRCFNPAIGEYYFANSPRLDVDTVYRTFTMTVRQMVKQFGKENVSETVRTAFESAGAQADQPRTIGHAIEPNIEPYGEVPRKFKFRDVYWEYGGSQEPDSVLAARGFNEFPALAGRWDILSDEPYGRSPGMDALGDIKQLQQETKRKAQAIDKMVNPPMLADMQLKNAPASLLPGGVTYVAGQTNIGMKPIYQVMPPVQEIMLDIKEVQERIRNIFFNDLFTMISQLQTVRTATEIDARREEKLVLLGPVLERFENEVLDPAIDRVFGIMLRGGLLGPPPPQLHGKFIQVEYVSMLAEAQRAVSTSGIERLFAQIGNIAAVKPEALDIPNWDEAIPEYASLLAVSPRLINTPEQIAQIRAARADQLKAQQAAQTGMAAVQGAKTLSETDVGGGQNALAHVMGNA